MGSGCSRSHGHRIPRPPRGTHGWVGLAQPPAPSAQFQTRARTGPIGGGGGVDRGRNGATRGEESGEINGGGRRETNGRAKQGWNSKIVKENE